MLLKILIALIVLALGAAIYVRVAPSDPAVWSVDPLAADSPGGRGWLVRPDGGDAPAPVFDATPQQVLTALDTIAKAEPRTKVLSGSVAEGRITYVVRSRVLRFPDYVTIGAVPVTDGAAPVLFSRARFGDSDIGVNRARTERWLADLAAALP